MKLSSLLNKLRVPIPGENLFTVLAGIIAYLLVVLTILLFVFPRSEAKFRFAQIARKDYFATRDLEFVNTQKTEALRQQAMSTVQPISKVDETKNQRYTTSMKDFLDVLNAPESNQETATADKIQRIHEKCFKMIQF